jgi:hypothetical protein
MLAPASIDLCKSGTAGQPGECLVALATGGQTRHLLLCRWGYSGPIVLQMRIRLESRPDGLCAPALCLCCNVHRIGFASLGTKVRAAEADVPYAGSAGGATLVIVGGHVVRHRC